MYEDDKEESNPLAALLGGGAMNPLMALILLQQAKHDAFITGVGLRGWIIDWAEQEYAKGNTSVCSQEDFDLLQEYKNRDSFTDGFKMSQSVEGKTQQVACIINDIRAENELRAKDKVTA